MARLNFSMQFLAGVTVTALVAWILLAVIPSVDFDAEASASASKFTRFSTLSRQIEKGAHLGLERPWTPVFQADHGLYTHHGHFCTLFREQAPCTPKLITMRSMPSMVADPTVRSQNSLEAITGTASVTTDMGDQSPGGRIASQSPVFFITFNTRAYALARLQVLRRGCGLTRSDRGGGLPRYQDASLDYVGGMQQGPQSRE
jgi:hypothetical protein